MTPPFSVHTTPHFDRLLKALKRRHPGLTDRFAETLEILTTDPHNLSRAHDIRRLEGVRPGEGHRAFGYPPHPEWNSGVLPTAELRPLPPRLEQAWRRHKGAKPEVIEREVGRAVQAVRGVGGRVRG